jgi:hypothetical protein
VIIVSAIAENSKFIFILDEQCIVKQSVLHEGLEKMGLSSWEAGSGMA